VPEASGITGLTLHLEFAKRLRQLTSSALDSSFQRSPYHVKHPPKSSKPRVLIVPIHHGGKLKCICNNSYNVSEIDQEDEGEVDEFFTQEYLPYYDLIKQSMIQEVASADSRYCFSEPSGCSRLYGVHIRSFERNDALAILAATRILDLFRRESCFVAAVNFEYDGREFDGKIAYIARSGKLLVFPPPLALMIQCD
jgi:hypothetical protein